MLATTGKNHGTIKSSGQGDPHCQWGTDGRGSRQPRVGGPTWFALWGLVSEGTTGGGWNHSFALQASPDTLDPIRPADRVERPGQRRDSHLFTISEAVGRVAENARLVPGLGKTCSPPRQRYLDGFGGCRSPEELSAPASCQAAECGRSSGIARAAGRQVRPIRSRCDFRVYVRPGAR
jgi:hypothetical protein